jgi:hypothetical protein
MADGKSYTLSLILKLVDRMSSGLSKSLAITAAANKQFQATKRSIESLNKAAKWHIESRTFNPLNCVAFLNLHFCHRRYLLSFSLLTLFQVARRYYETLFHLSSGKLNFNKDYSFMWNATALRVEKGMYNKSMKIDADDLLTVAQAAERRGTTRQAINYLVRQGKLSVVDIAGRRFLRRQDLDAFTPDTGGRPPKQASTKEDDK